MRVAAVPAVLTGAPSARALLGQLSQVRAAPCPVCHEVVAAGKDESLDARMDAHLRRGCATEAALRRQRKEKNMCSHPKCHKTELVPFFCRDCGQSYCIRYGGRALAAPCLHPPTMMSF